MNCYLNKSDCDFMSDNRDRKWDKRRKREKPKRLRVIKRLLQESLEMIDGKTTTIQAEDYAREVLEFLKKCQEHWPLMKRIGKEHPEIRRIVDALKEEGMDLIWEYNHRNWS
tara:strand:- start:5 stop:340 length:336 start_codon:yes stop_codon:yes gene_type:complete